MESESIADSGDAVREDALLFMSDASAEAERLTLALRASGYIVVDVPLALLAGRVAVQRPGLVLCDADSEGALDTLARIRSLSPDKVVPAVLIGLRDGAIARIDGSLAEAVFARPVNIAELVSTVERLVGSPRARVSITPSGRPGKPAGSSHPPRRSTVSERPMRMEGTAPPVVSLPPDLAADAAPREATDAPVVELAADLADRLLAAERRLAEGAPASSPASDSHAADLEAEAPLPPDVLLALDGPVDDEDPGEDSALREGAADGTGSLTSKAGTRAHTQIGTSGVGGTNIGGTNIGGTNIGGTNVGGPSPGTDLIALPADDAIAPGGRASAAGTRVSSEPPPASDAEPDEERRARQQASTPKPPKPVPDQESVTLPPRRPTLPPPTVLEPSPLAAIAEDRELRAARAEKAPPVVADADERPSTAEARAERGTDRPGDGREGQPSDAAGDVALRVPAVLRPGDAIPALAGAIRTRFTGAMAFEVDEGIRRVVLREGDFVTAASGVHAESLIAYLGGRGALPDDVVRQAHKLPAFGRRAGAALIANGHLAQDELWPVLRAHAEWIIERIARMDRGSARIEEQVLHRLQDEPAVFGGATGAEVLVEVVRRVVTPEEALAYLGGPRASVSAGPARSLLGECALPAMEADLVQHAASSPVSDLVRAVPDSSFAAALYALVALGILSSEGAPEKNREEEEASPVHDDLDDAAIRQRILARKALVDEGDYFAVLGIARNATGYDIRRAYTALRREFEPSRILTAATADLGETVTEIVAVLEEAYEILSDQRRRERYRRAIEAVP